MSSFGTRTFGSTSSAAKAAALVGVALPEEALQVEAKVTGVFPEYRQARALDAQGFEYALTRGTPGIDVRTLHEGQRLRCLVEPDLRRVLHAEVLA
jgi:hypothetical protein